MKPNESADSCAGDMLSIHEHGTTIFTGAIQWVEPAKREQHVFFDIAYTTNDRTDWQILKSQRY